MAENVLILTQRTNKARSAVAVQSYWGTVWQRFRHDKITVAALLLLIFMVTISLAAPWIY